MLKLPRILAAICFVFLSQLGFGQISFKQIWSPDGAEDGRAADHVIIDFVNCNYSGTLPEGVELRPYSLGINVSVTKDIRFAESNFSLGWGGGIWSHNVHSNARFVSILDSATSNTFTQLAPWHPSYDYTKNKVAFTYIDMPIELRYKSKNEIEGTFRRPFRVSLGFRVGYLVNAHDKRVDSEGLFKNYNIEHILKYRYGVYGRIGYGKVVLFGSYALTPIFEENRGIGLHMWSVGLSVVAF